MIRKVLRTALLFLCILLLVSAAVWLILSPQMEKQEILERQNELLESLERSAETPPEAPSAPAEAPDVHVSVIEAEPGAGETENPPHVTVSYEPTPTETPTDPGLIGGIGILTIDKIDLKLPVTEGVTDEQLKVAVGHVPQTAPIGGEGNAIIAGHRSYTYGHFFNRLDELEPGDTVQYKPEDGNELTFEVFEILEVTPDDPAVYADFPGEHILTLHTCTPVRIATHRLLIRAKLIS
jgi:sortase A